MPVFGKFLRQIPRRTLHTVSAVVFVLIVAFFGATRTEVGREELSRYFQKQFAQSYSGSLSIGRLNGNILNALYASDVAVTTDSGEVVLRIDSLVIRPKWSSILRRSFSISEVTLFQPELHLTLDSLGTSTLEHMMAPKAESEADSANAWNFEGAFINIRDATIRTMYSSTIVSAELPRREKISTIEHMSLTAQIDWQEGARQIDLLQVSGHLVDPDLTLQNGASQIVFRGGRILINQARIQTNGSIFNFRGYVEPGDSNLAWFNAPFQLDLDRSGISFDELSLLIPGLPLRGEAVIRTHIEGPLSNLTVAWFDVEKGNSSLELSGTVAGYPDSLGFDISAAKTRIISSDVRSLLPANRWMRELRVDTTDFELQSQGVIRMPMSGQLSVDLAGSVDLTSDDSIIDGSFSFEGFPIDTLNHDVSIRLRNLDLCQWTNRARLRTSITGSIETKGFSVGRDSVYSVITAALSDVSWRSRRAEVVDLALTLEPESISGDITVREGSGTIITNGSLSLSEHPFLVATIALERADVGPLLGFTSLRSTINAELTTRASLNWNSALEADFRIDIGESLLTVNDSTASVPAHQMAVRVNTPDSGLPVLDFQSDMFDVSVESEASLPTLTSLATAWVVGFRAAIDSELDKSLYELPATDDEAAQLALRELLAFDSAAERMPAGSDGVHTSVEVVVHNASLISSLSPTFPTLQGEASINAEIDWSPDSLSLEIDLESPHLSVPGLTLNRAFGRAGIQADRYSSISNSLKLSGNFHADTLQVGAFRLSNQDVLVDFASRMGSVVLAGSGTTSVDSLTVRANIALTDLSNSVSFTALELDARSGTWRLEGPADFTFYQDATDLEELRIRFFENEVPTGQAIIASGVLSETPSDSLSLTMENLLLRPFSGFLGFRRTIGGLMNAEMVFSGGRSRPRVAGLADVTSFSLDEKLLGDVSLTSSFVAGVPDVAIDLNLTPTEPTPTPLLFGTDLPATWIQNKLNLGGTIRLPGRASADKGALDLFLNVDRADLFFFKYIFQEALGTVSGYTTGSGTITGQMFDPIFDIDLDIVEGKFDIPRTQGRYELEGSVHIDHEAIHFLSSTITDQSSGTAQLTGRLLFNEYTAFTLDIDGVLDEFLIMNVDDSEDLPFYGRLRASGDLNLTGPLFNATLTSSNAQTRADSELYIPLAQSRSKTDEAFIVFVDSPEIVPDFRQLATRPFLLSRRPTAERQFLDGLNLDLNIFAPEGSTVHLVIDPLLGDVINAVSTGTVQLLMIDGELQVFGQLQVSSGDYQFVAGEVFIRKFLINEGGSIAWEGDPVNAQLDISAAYRTRASRAGLPGVDANREGLIPLIVNLQISGTVDSPEVDLSLSVDRSNQSVLGNYPAFEAQLNQPDRATEYATSVLVMNSFQLTTDNISSSSGGQLAFNSVSQLVSAQLNRFLNEALPNVDFSFGLQGEGAQDLDVTYGVALRLLRDRLIIRGEGVYQGAGSTDEFRANEGLQGEFVVEIRVGRRVSVEIFIRREGDILGTTALTNTAGVGLSYQTQFKSWRSLFKSKPPEPDGDS